MTQGTNPPATPAPPPDTVTLTINGRSVSIRKGTNLVEAAKQAGIEIPVFCYHEKLKSVGACRMCLVSIEKMPRLQTACTTPAGADMVVHSDSPEAITAQNSVIELLLANHPLDCPICDKGGECPLQDNSFRFGLGRSRFGENKRHLEKAFPLGERIVLDRERCIMCYRCVRFHQEIPGDEALAAVERGGDTFIGTLPGEQYSSIFSGNTIELCPVGALTSRQYRFKARPWDLVRTPSICDGCSVGCNLEVHSRVETVLRLVARENPDVDGGWLCDRGRFDTLPVASERHAVHPLVRVAAGTTEAVTWRRAIDRALELIGPAPGVLVSPHLSNEAIWLIANRLLPQLGGAPAALWPDVGGSWPVEGAITNLLDCKRIVLVGLDVWNDLPVLALWIRKAVAKGAQLVAVGDANGLFRDTANWLQSGSSPGDVVETADALRAALGDATGAPSEVAAAANRLSGAGEGPAALLVHPRLLREAGAEERLRALAEALGARGDGGLVGAPQLAANARGAHELAPSLAGTDPATVISAATSGQLSSLLLVGTEPWAELDTGQARLIVATTVLPDDDPRVDVVLPLAHAYESQGTITNFEGRVQHQQGGASPPGRARSDWGVAAELAIALGGTGLERLDDIRAAIAADHVAWQAALQPPAELVARV